MSPRLQILRHTCPCPLLLPHTAYAYNEGQTSAFSSHVKTAEPQPMSSSCAIHEGDHKPAHYLASPSHQWFICLGPTIVLHPPDLHSRLKTHLINKSFPPVTIPLSQCIRGPILKPDFSFLCLFIVFLVLCFSLQDADKAGHMSSFSAVPHTGINNTVGDGQFHKSRDHLIWLHDNYNCDSGGQRVVCKHRKYHLNDDNTTVNADSPDT